MAKRLFFYWRTRLNMYSVYRHHNSALERCLILESEFAGEACSKMLSFQATRSNIANQCALKVIQLTALLAFLQRFAVRSTAESSYKGAFGSRSCAVFKNEFSFHRAERNLPLRPVTSQRIEILPFSIVGSSSQSGPLDWTVPAT